MNPRLLTTPWFTIHTFGVMLALSYLSALGWLVRSARRGGLCPDAARSLGWWGGVRALGSARRPDLDPDAAYSLGWWAIVGALVGAKALMALRSWPEFAHDPSELISM